MKTLLIDFSSPQWAKDSYVDSHASANLTTLGLLMDAHASGQDDTEFCTPAASLESRAMDYSEMMLMNNHFHASVCTLYLF